MLEGWVAAKGTGSMETAPDTHFVCRHSTSYW